MLLLRRIGAVSAIGAVIVIGACGPSSAPGSTARPPATSTVASASRAAVTSVGLTAEIRDLVAGFDGSAGIYIARPGQPEPLYAANPDKQFIAASIYKLAVLLRVEGLVERGALSYDDTITIEEADVTVDGSNEPAGTVLTVDDALEEMIAYSDNGSALAFVRLYGAAETNAALAAAGIKGFRIAENSDEDHLVTARSVGTYFDLLATRRLISAAASDRMLVRLERQQINDRLPRDLPSGVAVAHKTGDLIGFIHDAGVIQAPDGLRIAVVLTSDGTEAAAKDLIARIGSVVYAADLPAVAAIGSGALPAAAALPLPVATLGSAAAIAVAVVVLAGLVLLRRSARRRARRATGPMTVWSPDRRRRR
ncbi:MAG TPA: serine hydrolase [Candidatus Limnocylindria bacterium]